MRSFARFLDERIHIGGGILELLQLRFLCWDGG
jgi:hypothetical protein